MAQKVHIIQVSSTEYAYSYFEMDFGLIVYGNLCPCLSPQPSSAMAISNVAAVRGYQGRYVHHGTGTLGTEGNMEEYYLISETEKRLDTTQSTLSFQGYEMKEKSSKV